jgi:hypothetical protein
VPDVISLVGHRDADAITSSVTSKGPVTIPKP